ncbi:hypothetical protein PtA15_1A130 [Puccinia triticina]|uniref:Uncharacterized protein n=1 Tax=Puccinia triticina TaxID=208348 RepID=A0ABY7CA52_9BASI|nr:uncharacterized protein PtA15_1A130 [Puccinia triticina]WAQ80792.1 hypothetical protein PtA15_1A130 [Puccinia triticina]WAR51686.1 hypothetical protein PtB15_1B122 [Puccinia triticina]
MGFTKSSSKSTNAHNAFMGRSRRDIDSQHFLGPIKSRVTYFNGSMTWMKGKALVKHGEEDLFCEFEGDPNFIERRFGGNVKRPREKTMDEDHVPDEEASGTQPEPKAHPTSERAVDPQPNKEDEPARVAPTPKRSRVSDPLGLGLAQRALAETGIEGSNEGPSRNTRSRAGSSLRGRGSHGAALAIAASRKSSGRTERTLARKGKGKGKATDPDQLAEITAGIDGFSVFSNHQIEEDPRPTNVAPVGPSTSKNVEMDAGEWAHPVTHSAKVGVWLERTAEAGSQAPAISSEQVSSEVVLKIIDSL